MDNKGKRLNFKKYPKELDGADMRAVFDAERLLNVMGTELHHYMPVNQASIVAKMAEIVEEAVGPYRSALARLLPHAEATAEASHLTDGFNRKPSNAHDLLVTEVKELLK